MILIIIGCFAGIAAAFFGMSGGVILVPILKYLNYSIVYAVGTASLCSLLSASSATYSNLKEQSFLKFNRVFSLAIPSIIFAQFGVYFVRLFSELVVISTYIAFLLILIPLTYMGKYKNISEFNVDKFSRLELLKSTAIGSFGGLVSGAFGIGGGVIFVPLQVLFLNVPLKVAIRISSAVIIFTIASSFIGHYFKGGVLINEGLILGLGGIIGASLGSSLLTKVPESIVRKSFIGMIFVLVFIISYSSFIR